MKSHPLKAFDSMSTISYSLPKENALYQIKYFRDDKGRSPYIEWIERLDDRDGRARIKVQIDRLEAGNFGKSRSLGGGMHELKIDFGPGYRVYFGVIGQIIVVLLSGGSKRTQDRDISKAKEYWRNLKEKIKNDKKT